MIIRPGEFWVAEIPFTAATGSKRRPVLVLWLDAADVVAAAVTTAQPCPPFDVFLADWKAAGLRRPSAVRLSRLDCLEQSLLIGRIGAISADDGTIVKEVWAKHIGPRF